MKRALLLLLALTFVIVFFGCEKAETHTETSTDTTAEVQGTTEAASDPRNENYRDHQELSATEAEFDVNNALRFDIPEVGLKNVFIQDFCNWSVLDPSTDGRVYLLSDDRYGGGYMPCDHYLLIVTDRRKMIVKDLSAWEDQASYFGDMHLCDLDGDGDDEIVLQQGIGLTGGAGQYLSRVFDYSGGEIVEIFTSEGDESRYFDTGYTATIQKGRKLRIDNSFTGFSMTLQYSDENDEFFNEWWYDENGEPKERYLMVDGFYKFIPKDEDGDGVYEIHCYQYTSLIGHSNGIGTAISVLKYNNDSGKFEVVEADFVPAVEENPVEIIE